MIEDLWIIYLLIFAAALLAVQSLYWLVFRARGERKIVNRRVALSAQVGNPTEVLDVLRSERGLGAVGRLPGLEGIDQFVIQSGQNITPGRALLWIVVVSGGLYLLVGLWFGLGLLGIPLAAVGAVLAGYMYLRIARGRRIARFSEQLPEAL